MALMRFVMLLDPIFDQLCWSSTQWDGRGNKSS